MVRIVTVSPALLRRVRPQILRFSRKYGDRRITHRALRWLNTLSGDSFPEGTWLAAAVDRKRLVGFILFGSYGLEEAFVVVHPNYRKRQVGESMLEEALTALDRVYTRVSCDNIPSLKLCFKVGLVAFKLTTGPTGKPTLCLGGGNWSSKEFTSHASSA
ncbi:MAG: GNAT family N-acetyltransferase [Firmicutes bacterium]|uniref:Acetyltransferase (GNAT) family protein n=1 Tax=Melghirimyces thermohalophilus TaxID=1236220 RepID=A0A1G6MJ81_9BACL|nr:GNAT family N-acetyltransferase [Melghirimyces thermohalophilus]MDA8354065.1 GNAT family N-acetyltransferase [Bacillota bacterium]SDC55569.1 Acetyltransferase (GNAT) family protein [Melghirimyces thermohalophilus]